MSQQGATIYKWLESLEPDPVQHPGVTLIVSRGDLSTDHERRVTAERYKRLPYLMMFSQGPLPGEPYTINGPREQVKIVDFVLQQRPSVEGERPPDALMTALYWRIYLELPKSVTHWGPGLPLFERPQWAGGLGEPEGKVGSKDWLEAGLAFAFNLLVPH